MSAQGPDELAVLGQTFLAERQPVLRRSLRALPDCMLEAMCTGLASHGDDLVPGRLFRSRTGGGCAVGVMLRELEPETYETGPLRFWLRDRWRRGAGSYRPLRRNPRLRHLQWTFDAAVKDLRAARANLTKREAATVVGVWFGAEAEGELSWRSLQAAARTDDRGARAHALPHLDRKSVV